MKKSYNKQKYNLIKQRIKYLIQKKIYKFKNNIVNKYKIVRTYKYIINLQ